MTDVPRSMNLPLLLAIAGAVVVQQSDLMVQSFFLEAERQKRRRPPRPRPVRDNSRVWHDEYEALLHDDFRKIYGVDKPTFQYILEHIREDLTSKYPQYARRHHVVRAEVQLALTLRYFRGERDWALHSIFKVGRSVRVRCALRCAACGP